MTAFTKFYLNLLNALTAQEEGQGMAEYGLIIALIAVVVIGVLTTMGTQIQAMFGTVATALGG